MSTDVIGGLSTPRHSGRRREPAEAAADVAVQARGIEYVTEPTKRVRECLFGPAITEFVLIGDLVDTGSTTQVRRLGVGWGRRKGNC